MKSLQCENLFCRNVSFFICTLCQVLGLEQGMKQASCILYFKLSGIYFINKITKFGIIYRQDISYVAKREIKGLG